MLDYKQMCIQQGYIPPTCKMDGLMCWLLIQEGKNPCEGCFHNREECRGRYQSDLSKVALELKEYYKELEKRKEKYKRIENHSKFNAKVVMSIISDYYCGNRSIEVKVNDIVNEKGYAKNFKSLDECVAFVPVIINNYGVQQIQIETNGFGTSIYDSLNAMGLGVDIVPITYTSIKLM